MTRAHVRSEWGEPVSVTGVVECYPGQRSVIYRQDIAVQIIAPPEGLAEEGATPLPDGRVKLRWRAPARPVARRPFLLRYGLEDMLGPLRAAAGQLQWFCREVADPHKRLAKVAGFVQARFESEHTVTLTWTPMALQLALREFLHHAPLGPGQDRRRQSEVPTDFLITRSDLPPGRRARVLAEAEIATLELRGSHGSRIVTTEDISEEECRDTVTRLEGLANGVRDVPLLAALARAVDEDRQVKIMADWETNSSFSVYRALADPDFKIYWSRVEGSQHDPPWPYNPAGRLLALARRPRARLDIVPFQDKLTPILQLLHRLRPLGAPCPQLNTLTSELELVLLRRLEAFPHLSHHEPDRIATHLIATAHEAAEFEPLSPAQRCLALGVTTMLELGLRALAIPCASS